MMDITPILTAVIGLLGTVITIVIIPWIKSKTTENEQAIISSIARTAVYAAQQMLISNADKKKYAIEYISKALESRNISITLDEVSAAIEAEIKGIKTNLTGEWKDAG